jgi:hypothetical protein
MQRRNEFNLQHWIASGKVATFSPRLMAVCRARLPVMTRRIAEDRSLPPLLSCSEIRQENAAGCRSRGGYFYLTPRAL